jgi:hypothetical protein
LSGKPGLPDTVCGVVVGGIIISDMAAYRGHARIFLKDLEAIRPSAIIDIIHSGEQFKLEQSVQKTLKQMRT